MWRNAHLVHSYVGQGLGRRPILGAWLNVKTGPTLFQEQPDA